MFGISRVGEILGKEMEPSDVRIGRVNFPLSRCPSFCKKKEKERNSLHSMRLLGIKGKAQATGNSQGCFFLKKIYIPYSNLTLIFARWSRLWEPQPSSYELVCNGFIFFKWQLSYATWHDTENEMTLKLVVVYHKGILIKNKAKKKNLNGLGRASEHT